VRKDPHPLPIPYAGSVWTGGQGEAQRPPQIEKKIERGMG